MPNIVVDYGSLMPKIRKSRYYMVIYKTEYFNISASSPPVILLCLSGFNSYITLIIHTDVNNFTILTFCLIFLILEDPKAELHNYYLIKFVVMPFRHAIH